MNKKLNTILFILGATVFNVLVAVLCFILLAVLYIGVIMMILPEDLRSWGFPLIFITSLVVSFFAYRYLLKFLLTKIDAEKYFDTFFVKRNIRRP